MNTSIKRTKSKVGYSEFPLRLSLPPTPDWRRTPRRPDPGTGIEDRTVRLRLVRPGQPG